MKQTILIALILFGSTFLIYETAHFCMAQGLPHWLCWMTAIMLEGGCILAATYKDKPARIIVCCFVGFVLFASSYGRIDPLLTADKTTAGQNRLIQTLDNDILSVEKSLADFHKRRQNGNYAATNRELLKKQAERAEILKSINASPQAAIGVAVIVLRSWGIVALRFFVQIFNIFLATKLGTPKTNRRNGFKTSHVETNATDSTDFELDSNAYNILEYIDKKGGVLKRPALLGSKKLTGVDAYECAIETLSNAGLLQISTNGKAANTVYRLV